MTERNALPRKRQDGLTVRSLADEVIIYDTLTDQANCLNVTAARVWQHADGSTTIPQIAHRVSAELGAPVDERTVWYALDQLGRKNLLEQHVRIPAELNGLSRREFLKRAALVGALVAVPTIVSVTAPQAAHAASCLAAGFPCNNDAECCSKNCGDLAPICL